jgi:putative DNA primase/helicase
MTRNIFKSIPNTRASIVYVYQEGVYRNIGESIIKRESDLFLEEKVKNLYVNEVMGCIERATYIFPEQINQDAFLINIKNGLYNLKEKRLLVHNPEIFSITQLPVFYDPEADCPAIKKFISEIVNPRDVEVVQELFGYLLWKDHFIQKAFMFLGEGSNGKSTLIRIMKAFLGNDNISNISLQDLDKNPFAKAALYGKMANLYPDISDVALTQTGTFKALTGGDAISAEFKFKDRFSFTNFAKLIFSCNKLPETRDFTSAFFRRWIFLNFPNKFEGISDDKQLINKLINEKELSGLFNWALEGLERLLKNQDFSYTLSTAEIEGKYKKMSSSIAGFVEDMCEQDSEAEITKSELYHAYCQYCKDNQLPADSDQTFHKKLPIYAPYIKQARPQLGKSRSYTWRGIKLISFTETQDERKSVMDFVQEEEF